MCCPEKNFSAHRLLHLHKYVPDGLLTTYGCHGLHTAGLYKEDACTIASMYIKVWFSFKETTLRKHLNNQHYIELCTNLYASTVTRAAVSPSIVWDCRFKYVFLSDFHHSCLGYLGYHASSLHIAMLLCLTIWHTVKIEV